MILSRKKNNDLNVLEKNIYGSLIQNQLINELEINKRFIFLRKKLIVLLKRLCL